MADTKGLSLDALKRRLSEKLRDTGALDQVKAKLRAQFVDQLNATVREGGGGAGATALGATLARTAPGGASRGSAIPLVPGEGVDAADAVAHSLVAEHLVAAGFTSTASVFEPECGARRLGGLCGAAEVLARLGVSPHATVHARLLGSAGGVGGGLSLLSRLVTELARPNPCLAVPGVAHGRTAEAAAQTDRSGPSPREALDQSLQEARGAHAARAAAARAGEGVCVEARVLEFQRQCEARLRAHYDAEQERWRARELEKVTN